MSKKPRKVAESASSYATKKAAKAKVVAPKAEASTPTIRYATAKQVREAAHEVFKVHEELFRKLAQ